jgi:4-hydroxybenzoate polyprenyltransferase
VPIFLAHRWSDAAALGSALLAFGALCSASSSMYLVNDLVDLEADRHHTRKRHRPLAAGYLPIPAAALWAVCLLLLAMAAGALVSPLLAPMLFGYVAITLTYSFWLKRVLMLDVVVLAGLYCYRILLGGAATGIRISPWTIGFSLFLFVSLALMKRYCELDRQPAQDESPVRRGYRAVDKAQVSTLGTASGMLSILVIALYIHSAEIASLYRSPDLLWLTCPIVLVWIGRLWILTGRGEMDEDPVEFALTDWWSIGTGVAAVLVVLLAASV